jgi:predicted dinucleotide-binding enzyme
MEKKKLSKKLTSKKEKVVEAKEEIVVDVNADQFLTREEQLTLEDATSNSEKSRLALTIAEQVLVNKGLEKQLADRAVIDAKNNVVTKDNDMKNRAKVAGDHIKSLMLKYKVVGNFQYDPISGRIIKE